MPIASRWNLRAENDCLFVDDTSLGKVVLQHNARPGMMPYIHPLRTADGSICLTADSPWHHPHQHGDSVGVHRRQRLRLLALSGTASQSGGRSD